MALRAYLGAYDSNRIALIRAISKPDAWEIIGIGRREFYRNYEQVRIDDKDFEKSLKPNKLYTKPVFTDSYTDFIEGVCKL